MVLLMREDTLEFAQATITVDHVITVDTPIEVALPVANAEPAPGDWNAATVTGVTNAVADRWTATYRVLIGPTGTIELPVGIYDWTVRLTDSPEIPIRFAGTLQVTPAHT